MSAFEVSDKLVKRANEKYRNLISLTNRYVKECVVLSSELEEFCATYYAEMKEPIPDEIGFEVTEAAIHLRAALDKMACRLAQKNGKGQSGVAFPFSGIGEDGNPQPFPRNPKSKNKFTDEQWAAIEAQKPFPGGNETLLSINTIANEHKHALELVGIAPSVPAVVDPYKSAFTTRDEHTEGEMTLFPSLLTEPKKKRPLIRHKNFRGYIHTNITPYIAFSDIYPVARQNVLTTLNQQIRLADHILKTFSRFV